MLAIIECMKHWRHYLEGSKFPVQVLSDHKNLEPFMTTKVLNRRQARWAEILSGYDFVIAHVPGHRNPADGPSRRPDYSEDVNLPSAQLIPPSALLQNLSLVPVFTESESLRLQILKALETDELATSKLKSSELDPPWSWREDGILLHDKNVYIPADQALRMRLMDMHHDSPAAGHFGVSKTLDLLSRNYYFPGMRSFVNDYVTTCEICSRAKVPRHAKFGELSPLPVPSGPWKSISCDFVVDLPSSKGYDSLLVFVDRFTKMCHLIPCLKSINAPEFARLFFDNVFRFHGLPDSIVSDRGSLFTSRFWTSLSKILKMKGKMSTSFHPQTDGQTERMNQTIEQYIRMFCNYRQDNWADLLTLAEFSYNNAKQASTKLSPFFANYAFHPTVRPLISPPQSSLNLAPPTVEDLVERLKNVHEQLVDVLTSAQNQQAKYYDAKHKPLYLSVGDKVWLLSTNIRTTRPSKKLDWKRLGPFTITAKIGLQAYRLQLPPSMKIHPTFHASLLEPYKESTLPLRTQPPPPPIEMDDGDEWEVEEILDSKFIRRKLYYLVKWKGFPISDNSWEPAAHLQNSPTMIEEFHSNYPDLPRILPARSTPRRVTH